MNKPDAVLSFEGVTKEFTEDQLLDLAKLLIKDESSKKDIHRFNRTFSPLMSIVSAMQDWREPPPPEPEFTTVKRPPIYTANLSDYFLDDIPEFARTIRNSEGEFIVTYPLLITQGLVNLLSLTLLGGDDLTGIIGSVKIQRIYARRGEQWKVIDAEYLAADSSFVRGVEGIHRNLYLNLKSLGHSYYLAGRVDTERGSLEFDIPDLSEIVAVDLAVEIINYNYHSAV